MTDLPSCYRCHSHPCKCDTPPTWYVVVRPDNGYPVLIYEHQATAELVARKNGYRVVTVVPA